LLPFATQALFNSYDRQHEPACLPDTRVDLLQQIYDWADRKDGHDEQCIFWLNGLAGTGKSTISRTVARRCNEQKRLGASFFFSKGGGDVSHAGKFFTSLAVQLARSIPSLQKQVCDAVMEQRDVAKLSLSDQWHQLILHPLSRLEQSHQSYVLIIDALDECEGNQNVRIILGLLAEARSIKTVRLRVFLTSRPEVPIRHGIRTIPQAEHQDFVLQDIPPATINHDISLFLEYNLGIIRQEWTLSADWPGEMVLRQLVLYACGLFIWAATACRFIREGKRFARKRLDTILKGSSSSSVTTPEKHLDEIYLAVLKHSISSEYSDEEINEVCDMLKHILGSLVVLLSPLSTSSLSRLLHLPKEDIDQTFEDLYAILDIPEDPTRQVRLHHPSFRDFLLSKDRCEDFWVNEKKPHQILVTSCIQLMSQALKKDVCEMHAPGSQTSQVESSRVEKCLPPEVQYACLYWVQHLQRGGYHVRDGEETHRFLQTHLLHWLEALGWMGKASEGIQAIFPDLYTLIHDAKRFALYNRSIIEKTPLQLYCSALVFAPGNSIIRRKFEGCTPDWIQLKPKVQAHWNAALQTLEGHTSSVNSVAFSPDSKQVVSGSCDETVRLWDTATGALLQTLKGHSSSVNSVAFSPDGKQVVSGSHDQTVRLWDAATGVLQQTLEGHSGNIASVASVAFSPDSKQVVSGSWDRTVRLWDAATGALQQTLEGHSSYIASVAFSPDSKQVVSGSWDKTVRLWDTATGALQQTLEGNSGYITSVAFSLDSKQVVSGSNNETVRLWDTAIGALQQTLEGHTSIIDSVAFSPNGKQVVSGSHDKTVRLWDTATGALQQTLEGHSSYIASVAFSPDSKQVVSGSWDKTVRLWDTATGALQQMLEGHSGNVTSVAFSPDSKQVVSGSGDRTVRLWDTATGALQQTLKGHTNFITSV
ncbi:WD40-repeat-containing domain protein, partial [Hyaloscypha finlandica]